MKHSTGYRKVLLFVAMAASCVALALFDKISGDAALAAITAAFSAALGLNIMEHRRGVVPPALPRDAMPPLPRAPAVRRSPDLTDPGVGVNPDLEVLVAAVAERLRVR